MNDSLYAASSITSKVTTLEANVATQSSNWQTNVQSIHEEVGTGGQCNMWVWRARTDGCSKHQQLPTS